jgi:hypothetical protein
MLSEEVKSTRRFKLAKHPMEIHSIPTTNESIHYRAEERVRPISLMFTVFFSAVWFFVWGKDIFLENEPWTTVSIVAALFVFPAVLYCTILFIKGGSQRIEIDDESIKWSGPFVGSTSIRHEDVESFKVVSYPTGDGGPDGYLYLKTGKAILIPSIGDQMKIHNICYRIYKAHS